MFNQFKKLHNSYYPDVKTDSRRFNRNYNLTFPWRKILTKVFLFKSLLCMGTVTLNLCS